MGLKFSCPSDRWVGIHEWLPPKYTFSLYHLSPINIWFIFEIWQPWKSLIQIKTQHLRGKMFPSQSLHLLCNAGLVHMLTDSFTADDVCDDSPISQSTVWRRWPVCTEQFPGFVGNRRGRINLDPFVDDCCFWLSSHLFPSSGRKISVFLMLTTHTQHLPVWYLGEADFNLLFIEAGTKPRPSNERAPWQLVLGWVIECQVLSSFSDTKTERLFLRFRITIYLWQHTWAIFPSTWI